MPVNLAPNHKRGLVLSNPLMLGGGTIGYGDDLYAGLALSAVGAVVIGPITRYSNGGTDARRVVESLGGFVLNAGLQNRGISSALKKFSALWTRLDAPIILQIADNQPEMLAEVVEKVNRACEDGLPIAGFELALAEDATEELTERLVETVVRKTDLPLLVRLPLEEIEYFADAAVYAGADSLVVGHLPKGLIARSQGYKMTTSHASPPGRVTVAGSLGGPATVPQMLHALARVAKLNLDCTLVACGGIHSASQAIEALTMGAVAVQLDSVVWVEPGMVEGIATRLGEYAA